MPFRGHEGPPWGYTAAVNFRAEPLSRYDRCRVMTDLAVAQIATGENAAAPPAKSRTMPQFLSQFTPRLRKFMPRLGIVPRLTLIGVLSIFAAVAVSIWTSVKITEAEMYRRAQINLSINIKLLDSILAGYGAPSRKGDELLFRLDADQRQFRAGGPGQGHRRRHGDGLSRRSARHDQRDEARRLARRRHQARARGRRTTPCSASTRPIAAKPISWARPI